MIRGLFKFLKSGEKPVDRFADDILGTMVWSPTEEAWHGEYGGLTYLIAYDRAATPTPALLAYAREVLGDAEGLRETIGRSMRLGEAEYPAYADEVQKLEIDTVSFFEHKRTRRMLVSLAGGRDGRAWRVEFKDQTCEGIGFDD